MAIVRSNGIIQIHADVVKVGRNKSHDWNEPGGSGAIRKGPSERRTCQRYDVRVDRQQGFLRKLMPHQEIKEAARGLDVVKPIPHTF